MSEKKDYDVIIIGAGCSGLTAAIYSSRANLDTLVIEGSAPGGQLTLTSEVENYPGFPEGINGPELVKKFRDQAERFGTQYITKNATAVDFSEKTKKVKVGEEEYTCKAVIISTGSETRWLGIPGEKELMSRGVSSCATCDGAFFKNKVIIVIGGGDSAMEEALFLTKFATKVTVIHRRNKLRASKIMQERALNHKKIEFIWNTEVVEFMGEQKLEKAILKNLKTGKESEIDCQGAFVAIGHDPATKIFNGKIELDEKGYAKALKHTETSQTGVFVSGDVEDFRYMQAVTAAGDGCRAAIDAERYIEENK
jgi:thioredoxin reductase (NADPH)